MEVFWIVCLSLLPCTIRAQGVYAPAHAQITHLGQACVAVKEDNIIERVYTIREGDTLVLQCLVKGHPRPQVRWTKTAGSASDKFQETSIFDETLRIERIQRIQGGRYYCKADNGVGVPAIKSIRVDVQYLDEPILTVHQTISDVRGSFYQEKTVFLRCTVNSNPPARFIWKRGNEIIAHNQDNGVDIYEPLYTQGETKVLKLKNLRPQDYASYTCQVSVRNVCNISDKSVTFKLTNTTAPPSLKLSVDEVLVVNPGDNVTIQCSLTGGDPVPSLQWSHSPTPMPRNSRVQGGNLTIWGIQPEDAGYYNCTASNNVGNVAKKVVNVMVRLMRNATFQIIPDTIKESETIQLGRELKLSCHVDAVPQDKVNYTWYKNGKNIKLSDRMELFKNDPELTPVTGSLEIIDLRFTDFGTYLCVASLPGSSIPDISMEVNISSETVPPTIRVPKDRAVIMVREGSRAELQCEVSGKPKPSVLWFRADKEVPWPSGSLVEETEDGKLQLDNVSREMSGAYKCQTARYNGFYIKPREAQVQLNVLFPPAVEPAFQDSRQKVGSSVTLRCTMVKGNPLKVASATWRLNSRLVRVSQPELLEFSEFAVDSFSSENNGTYECTISNDVGSASCCFAVSAKAYSPEFYYDSPNPIKSQKQSKNYSYTLQWTQKKPDAVSPVFQYRLDVRQLPKGSINTTMIPTLPQKKGKIIEWIISGLKIPERYEVRLTPVTSFGPGDSATRIIEYIEPIFPVPPTETCNFEDKKICGFTQDRNDKFDWIRQNSKDQNPSRSPNTGPTTDRSGDPQGYFMFIEASRPRAIGDKARLISPQYNITSKAPYYKTAYCISFYYHMYGKHIGSLNVLVRVRTTSTIDTQVWTLSGNQGNQWKQAFISINPSGPFQIVFEGVRGTGFEGDIAIDDITVVKGECRKKAFDPPNKAVLPKGIGVRNLPSVLLHGLLLFGLYLLLR
nr:PREDICTED: MAM domain-containing glycosylphosphatidylinositol anchor protein 1 [Latimeria chalumnae]|eukprot:XP_006006576.1 PREDICTED: MAM domain-containing glycosylphosphatidylinositol anchor protein 1 [Latimeria chalumnae]